MWRPSADGRAPDGDRARRAARLVTVAATVVFVLVLCRWRPWDLFDRAGFSTDFYDEQARSFVRGRLAVRPEVANNEGFLIDGDTYLYYGPFLALVRVPFTIFGDALAQRLSRLSMTLGFVAYCTGCYHLVELARRWAHTRWHVAVAAVASPWRTALFVAAAACSPMLFLTGWVSVYHETELWAATFALWSAVAALRLSTSHARRDALVTAAFIIAALLTRAPVGIGAGIGAGLVALLRWHRDRRGAIIVAGAGAVGLAIHSALNWARFGSLMGLPADRQVLSLQDPARAAWFAGNNGSFFSIRFLPTTIVQYLRPDTVRFERLVPFVRYGPLTTDHGSYPVESVTPASSLPAGASLLFVAALIGLVVIARRRDLVWVALVIGAAIAAVPTLLIGFIANRYLVDMLPLLLVPAAIAFVSVAVPNPSVARHRALRACLVALGVWGAWSNVALATWTQNLKEPGFTELRYRVDGALFGDPAPSLVALVPGAPVPRDGVVGLTGEPCDGVYIAEQGSWVNLERVDGLRQLTGQLDIATDGPNPVASGAGWDIALEWDPAGGVRPALTTDADRTVGDLVDVAAGAAVRVRVVNDDVVGQFFIEVNGVVALFRFGPFPDSPLPSAEFRSVEPAGETLCQVLERRR